MPRDIVLREGQGIPSESGTEACDREDRPATTGHQITRTATVNADGGPPRVLGHCPPAVRLTARQRQRLPRGGQAALRALRQALRRRRRKGNLYRYRYYVCFSRQRYGQATCAADRLPADELDRALLEGTETLPPAAPGLGGLSRQHPRSGRHRRDRPEEGGDQRVGAGRRRPQPERNLPDVPLPDRG